MLYDEADECANCPRLTGIPPHIALLSQIAVLKSTIETTSESFGEMLRSELNRRSVGGEVFHANAILDDVRQIHEQMLQVLNAPGPRSDLSGGETRGVDGSGARNTNEAPPNMYVWGGRFHNVPENFVIPKMNLHTLIVYWFCGSKHPLVPPLKFAKSWDFKNPRTIKVILSQMRLMISHVTRAYQYIGHELGPDGINTPSKATVVYEAVNHLFKYSGTNNDRRYCAMTWKTIFLDLQKHKFKFVGETS